MRHLVSAIAIGETAFFLMTSKQVAKAFVLDSDREYFSVPVRVELHHTEVRDRTLFVRDPVRDQIYPVRPADVWPEYRLSKRQRAAARR